MGLHLDLLFSIFIFIFSVCDAHLQSVLASSLIFFYFPPSFHFCVSTVVRLARQLVHRGTLSTRLIRSYPHSFLPPYSVNLGVPIGPPTSPFFFPFFLRTACLCASSPRFTFLEQAGRHATVGSQTPVSFILFTPLACGVGKTICKGWVVSLWGSSPVFRRISTT